MDLIPRLVERDGRLCWRIDLRPRELGDLGQHWLPDVPPVESALGAAVNAAHRKHAVVRSEAEARATQLRFDLESSPRFKMAALELLDLRLTQERPSHDNAKYIRSGFRAVARELGHLFLVAFVPPLGNATLVEYRNRLVDDGHAPKTRRNRLSFVGQTLRYAWDKGWLPALPAIPSATVGDEVLNRSSYVWLAEEDFTTLYERLWDDWPTNLGHGLWKQFKRDRAAIESYVARRKLYLAAGFYTGMHTRNLDELDDRSFAARGGTFLRSNHKSARCIRDARKPMPERLHRYVVAEVNRLGDFWRAGDLVAGGRWTTVTRVLDHEAQRLGLPRPITPTVFRHSVAYHLALLGWSIEEAADYLGHIDTRMIREVYNQALPRDRSPVRLDWTDANMAKIRGGITSRAVVFDFERERESHRGGPGVHDRAAAARVAASSKKGPPGTPSAK